jgi:hypothetical protein
METIRANNQSFLLSSIYKSAQDNESVSFVTDYHFDRSIPPSGIDYGNEVSVPAATSNNGFSNSYTLEIPRQGFSMAGHLKLQVKVETATQNGAIIDVMSGAKKNLLFGLLHSINTLELRTKKEVLYRHNQHSLKAWLEGINHEQQREAFRLVMCQGVNDDGSPANQTVTAGAGNAKTVNFYIPMGVFAPFMESSQAIDLDFAEPVQLKITFEPSTSLTGAFATVTAGGTLTCSLVGNLVVNTSNLIYDADARNSILENYNKTEGGKIQKITYDYYLNNNVGKKLEPIKLEGMKNVLCLYVMVVVNASQELKPVKSVRLTSGNKTVLSVDNAEAKILTFRNFKGGSGLYKDTFVYELNFSLKDHTLVGNSFGGALSVENLVDPRLIVDHDGAANDHSIYIVAKQLSVLHMQVSNGGLLLGSAS